MSVYNSLILNVQPLELIDQSIGKSVHVITNYGIEYNGTLEGIDATVNCVLSNADEVNVLKHDTPKKHHNLILVNGAHISIIVPTTNNESENNANEN